MTEAKQFCSVCNKTNHNTDKCWGPGTQVVVPVYTPITNIATHCFGVIPNLGNMKSSFDNIFGKK